MSSSQSRQQPQRQSLGMGYQTDQTTTAPAAPASQRHPVSAESPPSGRGVQVHGRQSQRPREMQQQLPPRGPPAPMRMQQRQRPLGPSFGLAVSELPAMASLDTSFADDDPLETAAAASAAPMQVQPEPEVNGNGIVSLGARVEYSALPRGHSQDVFGLVTLKASTPPPVIASEATKEQRQPMDLICVLDVSGSMQGAKIRQVQDAMRFIIDQALPEDRVGIVAFNHDSTRPLRLRRMDSAGKNDAIMATLRLQANGGTSIAAGLNSGLLGMEQRRQRNKVSAMLLLTDGQDSSTRRYISALTARAAQANCGLYCFGFGADHDAALLSEIAEQARTPFTFVEDVEQLRESFAGVVGGLASVVAQSLQLSLSARVPITAVHTPFAVTRASESHVTVLVPDLMAEERRDVLVELAVPSGDLCGPLVLLEASLRYLDLQTGAQVQTPKVAMETERCDEPQPELEPDEEVSTQRERVEVTRALKRAAAASDEGNFEQARQVIDSTEQQVRSKKTKQSEAMCLELQDARSRMASRQAWEQGGRAEISDACQMHSMQRCTKVSSAKCGVQKMSKQMYVSQAQSSMIARSQ